MVLWLGLCKGSDHRIHFCDVGRHPRIGTGLTALIVAKSDPLRESLGILRNLVGGAVLDRGLSVEVVELV